MDENRTPIIYSYTRSQAIEDGVLIDVTPQAMESGFKVPVAVGDHLYHRYIVPPDGLDGYGQSIKGRLHDVLYLAQAAAIKNDGWRVVFDCMFLMGEGPRFETVKIVAVICGDDQGKPAITICLPEDE